MKTLKISQLLYLILIFGCASIQAETMSEPEKDSVSPVLFGKVDAIYPKESRMVIDDYSYKYTANTKFYYDSGKTGGANSLKPGTPVKFHAYSKPPYTILKDLKIISSGEFKESQKALLRERDD